MKKILLPLALILAAFTLNGQKVEWWLDAGLKYQWGPSAMFNSAISDSPNWDFNITTGNGFGGRLGINSGYVGISFELMYSSVKGSFDNNVGDAGKELKIKGLDLYTLFRNSRNRGYFELGPKFNFMRSADLVDLDAGGPGTAVDDDIKGTNMAAVLGFGTYLLGNDGAFSGIIGLRFEYGFTGIINDSGIARGLPVDDPAIYASGSSSTNPIFAGLVFELNWGIGYYGQSRCGERAKFIMF